MKRLLTTTALGLLIAAGPALAQTSQQAPSPASPPAQQNQPDTGSPAAPSAPESPGASGGQQPGADSSQPGASSPDTAQSDAASPLTEETLASNLIGVAVENASGETIGEITDIVLAQDGSVKAALIGVGGFLGMGAKNVSVDFSELNVKRDDANNMTVTVAMSSESLEAMPAYQEKGTASEAGGTETSGTSTKTEERAPGAGTSPTPGTQ